MKRKTITLVVYMLVCLSLVSVGFAAWIITGGEGKEVQGNITANPVVDESISISQSDGKAPLWIGGKSTIIFGRPEDAVNGTNWLQFDNNVPVQNLAVTYQIYISAKSGTIGDAIERLDSSKVALKFVISDQIDDAVEAGFISCEGKGISFRLATSGDFTTYEDYDVADKDGNLNNFRKALKDVNTTEQVIQVKVEFGWGTKFNSLNPFNYYKTKDPTSTNKTDAYNNLNSLYTTLGGVAPATKDSDPADLPFKLQILIGAEPAAQPAQGTN